MDIKIPTQPDEIVEEIARFTDLPRDEIERRVRAQFETAGWNVTQDMAAFGATPHVYDERMARLYREGYGFIFETLVFWARPSRQHWSEAAMERISLYAQRRGLRNEDLKILMFGDGTGNDTLYLTRRGFTVDWFDFPDSKTFAFAAKRFEHYGLVGRRVNLLTDYHALLSRRYDVILCFEVLEHLPDCQKAIGDMATLLKDDGIALITEAFRSLNPAHPTHLAVNGQYDGRTPFLFLGAGLWFSWYSLEPKFKPSEYVKLRTPPSAAKLRLFLDFRVSYAFLRGRLRSARH